MFQLPVVRHNYAWAGCMPAGALLSFTYLMLDHVALTKHAAALDWPPPSRCSCMLYTCVLFWLAQHKQVIAHGLAACKHVCPLCCTALGL